MKTLCCLASIFITVALILGSANSSAWAIERPQRMLRINAKSAGQVNVKRDGYDSLSHKWQENDIYYHAGSIIDDWSVKHDELIGFDLVKDGEPVHAFLWWQNGKFFKAVYIFSDHTLLMPLEEAQNLYKAVKEELGISWHGNDVMEINLDKLRDKADRSYAVEAGYSAFSLRGRLEHDQEYNYRLSYDPEFTQNGKPLGEEEYFTIGIQFSSGSSNGESASSLPSYNHYFYGRNAQGEWRAVGWIIQEKIVVQDNAGNERLQDLILDWFLGWSPGQGVKGTVGDNFKEKIQDIVNNEFHDTARPMTPPEIEFYTLMGVGTAAAVRKANGINIIELR